MKWNISFGIIGFVVTTLASLISNVWSTSLIRGAIAFVIWFLLAFAVRYVVQLLLTPSHDGANAAQNELNSSEVGHAVDYTTPDDTDSLYNMLHKKPAEQELETEQGDKDQSGFQPLTPPKLVSKPLNEEQLAEAVRHLTQK
ncbi:hypothetical protein [Paenibacillus marinisediminis]